MYKGGRGHKAPYETTHVRIPLPIKDRVEALSNAFKNGEILQTDNSLTQDKIVEIAQKIISQKKSSRVSLEKFIKEVFELEVKL